jgi:hypothetical protein
MTGHEVLRNVELRQCTLSCITGWTRLRCRATKSESVVCLYLLGGSIRQCAQRNLAAAKDRQLTPSARGKIAHSHDYVQTGSDALRGGDAWVLHGDGKNEERSHR